MAKNTSDIGYKLLCPALRDETAKRTGHDLDLDCPYMHKAIAAAVAANNMDHRPHSHHGHGHAGHGHVPASFDAAFAIGTGLNLALVLAQLGFGYLSNSLALISDGVHNFTDVLGLLLAWGASCVGRWQPSPSRTYGFRRASILAALGNAALLLVATGAIVIEAARRFAAAPPVESNTVLWVASIGIVLNVGTALLFKRGRKHDLNIASVVTHMVGDAALSLGVVITALLIGRTGWRWLDPLMSIAIALAIFWISWRLIRDAMNMALDAVPRGVDPSAVQSYLSSLPGVSEVHDLHIWAMSTTETALTVHLVRADGRTDDAFLMETAHDLDHRFGIHHSTIQIETGERECRLAPTNVV
jgi:cobalt-zinc-cadmium efflux system protein